MIRKVRILEKISNIGVVAVVRADSVTRAKEVSLACMKGGIPLVEITYTVPGATDLIQTLKRDHYTNQLLVGAGTVLDAETARLAILAGADFIVSPNFNLETAKLCNRYCVPYMPGCMTIQEMVESLEAGCDIIKLFPSKVYDPSFIKDVKAPLPQVNIMPTGGVNLGNVQDWIKNGAVAVGVGGQLANGAPEQITKIAKQFVQLIREARQEAYASR
jgi:2-dehydro-3-deoxyphosphogluconate aldolase / (4S)-4-hydroxy-2-oxoglutarate aldolase